MKLASLTLLLMSVATPLLAAVEGRDVEYSSGEAACLGYVAVDSAVKEGRPGVLVIHDWMGVTEHTKEKCQELAKMGYVAFAADIYGKGVRPADAKEASGLAGKFRNGDRALLRQRAMSALEQLQKQAGVEKSKIAAIGYCFGGTTVLELGRAGADVAGLVSFHGGLDSPKPEDGKNIKAKVLILHGAEDPFVKEADLKACLAELTQGKVDWQMVAYADTVHSFTQPWVGTDKSKGAAYNEKSARRSWQATENFFGEIFK